MIKKIVKIVKKILPPTKKDLRMRLWKSLEPKRLRYVYNLNQDSIVFDLGGYKGQWSSDIFSMYTCNIFIFEPIKKYYEFITDRFKYNSKIKTFNFGLSDKDTEIEAGLADDGTSIYNTNTKEKEKIKLKSISDFINSRNIKNIELIKINIEGGEYDLLENMIKTGTINKCSNIQIQFHDFVPNAQSRMQKITKDLEKTHRPTYKVDFVWENWEKINK